MVHQRIVKGRNTCKTYGSLNDSKESLEWQNGKVTNLDQFMDKEDLDEDEDDENEEEEEEDLEEEEEDLEDEEEDFEEEEDEEYDDEEEVDSDYELKNYGIALELPKRSNRGKNLRKLIGEDLEKDELFWNDSIWQEEEKDEEYVNSEGEEEYRDITDSDFDDVEEEEEENSEEENGAEENAKRKNKMMNTYLDKLKKKQKFDEDIKKNFIRRRQYELLQKKKEEGSSITRNDIDECHLKNVLVTGLFKRTGKKRGRKRKEERDPTIMEAQQQKSLLFHSSRSKRDTTRQKTEMIKQLSEMRKMKKERRGRKPRDKKAQENEEEQEMTREQRMEEVKITEEYNTQSLLQLQAWEEEKKRYIENKRLLYVNPSNVFFSYNYSKEKEYPLKTATKYYLGFDYSYDVVYTQNQNTQVEIMNNTITTNDLNESLVPTPPVQTKDSIKTEPKEEIQYISNKVENNIGTIVPTKKEMKTDREELTNEKPINKEDEKNNQEEEEELIEEEKQIYIVTNPNELSIYSNYMKDSNGTMKKEIEETNRICSITSLEGKYYDPLTKRYYNSVDSFKLLRMLHYKNEYDKVKNEIKTLESMITKKFDDMDIEESKPNDSTTIT